MQNTGKTHFKRTSIDNFLNKLVLYIGRMTQLFGICQSMPTDHYSQDEIVNLERMIIMVKDHVVSKSYLQIIQVY